MFCCMEAIKCLRMFMIQKHVFVPLCLSGYYITAVNYKFHKLC